MADFVIRRYKSPDKEKVKDLYKLASIHSETGYNSGPWEADFDDIDGHYFNGGEFLVGLVNNEIVAIGGYRKIADGIGQIRRMRVHPAYRRKGYAQQIIQKLEKEAKEYKISELKFKTSKQQKMAQTFLVSIFILNYSNFRQDSNPLLCLAYETTFDIWRIT